jgi:hypothetical protein
MNQAYSKQDYLEAVRSIEAGRTHDVVPAYNTEPSVQVQIASVDPGANLPWLPSLGDCLAPMRELGIVRSGIVHGSFGDYTQTPFSDLEITLLLADGVTSDRDKLETLRKWRINEFNPLIVRIDPLQHHGPFYLWPELLSGYDEGILPIICYEAAWSLDDIELSFSPRVPVESDASEPLLATLVSLARYESRFFQYGRNPYSIKRLVSNLLLVPAFLYQSKGITCTKGDAIQRIRATGMPSISTVINVATELRERWPQSPGWLGELRSRFIGSTIPSGRRDQLIVSLYRHAKLQNQVKRQLLPIIPDFCQEIIRLYGSDTAFQ